MIATIRPSCLSNGILHFVSLSNAATARDTAASLPANRSRTARLLRPAPHHLDRQPEFVNDLTEKLAAAQQRFQQDHPEIWPGDRQRHAGQSRAAADIDDLRFAGSRSSRDRRGVQQVPVPQPVDFPRPEQAALHSGGRQQLRVPLSQVETRPEDLPRRPSGSAVGRSGLPAPDGSTCFT